MKIKRMVKRLLAVGAGAVMLGATAAGAFAAADLKSYPTMFVKDGSFDGVLVVGEKAQPIDNLALTDIAANMKTVGAAGATTTTTISGDAWLVKSGNDVLEFGESIGPSTAGAGVVDFVDSSNLGALADGTFANSKGTFDYEQFIYFDNAQINTTYQEDDDDKTDTFVKIKDGVMFARYQLNFIDAAESDIDASDSFNLKDYDDKSFTMLGKTFDVVKAQTQATTNPGGIKLTLMSGSARDNILEGESKTYTIKGKTYDVSLTFTNSANQAKFIVNGEATPLMDESDTEKLSDGTIIGLSEVLYQDYAGGVHQAEFFLGADKLELIDDAINQSGSTDSLQVNDETIDGAQVEISGSIIDQSLTTTDDGSLEIDLIEINMTSQDDYFIAKGETLGGQPELDEKDLLFSQNWDIRFEGMDDSIASTLITAQDSGGEKEYQLTFTNVGGKQITMPLAYADAATSMRLGDQDDQLQLNNSNIGKDNYFILNDDSDEDSITQVVQYKGADKYSNSEPKIKFKILSTGEIVERPVTHVAANAAGASATLTLAGTSYTINNHSAVGNTGSDDWNITVTGGTDNSRGTGGSNTRSNFLIAKGGAKIYILDWAMNDSSSNSIQFNVSLIDADQIDDVNVVPYLVKGFNITVASQELDLGTEIGITLTSPSDDDDNSYGWSGNGAWVRRYSPSTTTSADQMHIDWPEEEKTPLVYVTSGATAASSSTTGDLVAVTIPVGATKLDSEVASTDAQNVVAVGGPCVNTVAADLLGNPAVCTTGFTPGKARIKLWEHSNGKISMLVAGYTGADTRLAGKVVAQRWRELFGMEVEVAGTTYTDATIKAPSSMTQ